MKCHLHPEAEAEAACTRCGRAVCHSCAVDVGGKVVCKQCLATAPAAGSSQESTLSKNPLAIASLVLAALGLLSCLCGGTTLWLVFGPSAAITGYLGRKKALEAGQEQQIVTLATVGLVVGGAETVLSLILLLAGVALLGGSLLSSGTSWR